MKLRDDPESLDIMEKAATVFSSQDKGVTRFQHLVRRLERSLTRTSSSSESESQSPPDDLLGDLEPVSLIQPQDKKRRVRFDDDLTGLIDAEMNESIDRDSVMSIATASDDHDDTTWSNGSEDEGLPNLEPLTSMLKVKFLEIIGDEFEEASGLRMDVAYGPRFVKNGTSRFSSTNDGRYSFHLPDHEFGGAEIFGTEDKRRGTSKSQKHKDKLQIQVAGEMLATVILREVLGSRHIYAPEILKACPNLQSPRTETSRTVYYLVFTHLSLRVAKAIFDPEYLNQVQKGYLPEHLHVDIMWSHRLRLNHEEDLRKAARLVMCLMMNFRDEFVSGKHYWLPYTTEVEEGTILVID